MRSYLKNKNEGIQLTYCLQENKEVKSLYGKGENSALDAEEKAN